MKIDCRTFLFVYTVDKGLHGRNVLQSVVIDSATYLLKINFSNTICDCMKSSVQVCMCVCRVISQHVAVVQFECMLVCIQESSRCSLVVE